MTRIDMRSLSQEAKFARRVNVIELRDAGHTYSRIATLSGLSRTGVFDICKRHDALGLGALRDAPGGRKRGNGRLLAPAQESLVRQTLADRAPDELGMSDALWSHAAVAALIGRRLGVVLAVRTLGLYLSRWGFVPPELPRTTAAAARAMRWSNATYPAIAAKARVEDGDILWVGQRPLGGEAALAAPAAEAGAVRTRMRSSLSLLSSVSRKGHWRWLTFAAPLEADILVDFFRRSIKNAGRKLFLILDDLRLDDDGPVASWLAEHEDAIEVFRLPDPSPASISPDAPGGPT